MYKILVVDDSALMRRVICDIINADSDFRVVDVSADGEDAYNKIKNNPYDLIVLDMVLPKLTGLELLERLYNEKFAFNAVIVSSILKEDADKTVKAMEYGALDFVVKPIRSGSETRDVFGRQLLTSLHNVSKSNAFRPVTSTGGSSSNSKAFNESRQATQDRLESVKNHLENIKSGSGSARTASDIEKMGVTNQAPQMASSKPKQEQAQGTGSVSTPATPSKSVPTGSGVRTKKIIALACSTGGPQADERNNRKQFFEYELKMLVLSSNFISICIR